MEQSDPRQLLIHVAKTLDQLDILYAITGGMAVFIWGRPRFTADIDIVVELEEWHIANLEKALKAFGGAGYIDRPIMKEALARRGEFNFIDGNSGVKVDFWVGGKDSFSRSKMERRVPIEFEGEKVYFVSPEDLILSKLLWHQMTPSSRQLEDVESVFKISWEKLDKEYLMGWAKELGVSEFLAPFVK